jgi:hypothetical protein
MRGASEMSDERKVGDTFWYVLGNGVREQAKVTAITSATAADIVIVTGEQRGHHYTDVPWGILLQIEK